MSKVDMDKLRADCDVQRQAAKEVHTSNVHKLT